jgi:hypothetical protein
MNKFKSIFKVLTFLDVEIFILCTMMVLSIYFSNKYIQKSIITSKELTSQIIKNDSNTLEFDVKYRQFKNVDDELLFKSLGGKRLDTTLDTYNLYKIHFSQYNNTELNFLLIEKEEVFKNIYKYKIESDKKINFKKFEEKKKIPLVVNSSSTGSIKRLQKTTSDTLYNTIVNVDAEKLISNLETNKKNYDSIFNSQIYKNAIINIKLRDIIDDYNNSQNEKNIISQNKIVKELSTNYKNYMIVLIVTIFVFTICISLIVIDIKKIYRKDDRNEYLISVLINQFTIE